MNMVRQRSDSGAGRVGVYFTDGEGRCLHVNQSWSEITGLSAEQSRYQGWVHTIHHEDLLRVANLWDDFVRTGRPFQAEYRLKRPQGRTVRVIGKAWQVRPEGDAAWGYVLTIRAREGTDAPN